MKTFNEYITEEKEYGFMAKQGFEKKGSGKYSHPDHGTVHISKQGEWKHIPKGKTAEDGFQGTTGATLKAHLEKV